MRTFLAKLRDLGDSLSHINLKIFGSNDLRARD